MLSFDKVTEYIQNKLSQNRKSIDQSTLLYLFIRAGFYKEFWLNFEVVDMKEKFAKFDTLTHLLTNYAKKWETIGIVLYQKLFTGQIVGRKMGFSETIRKELQNKNGFYDMVGKQSSSRIRFGSSPFIDLFIDQRLSYNDHSFSISPVDSNIFLSFIKTLGSEDEFTEAEEIQIWEAIAQIIELMNEESKYFK